MSISEVAVVPGFSIVVNRQARSRRKPWVALPAGLAQSLQVSAESAQQIGSRMKSAEHIHGNHGWGNSDSRP
jgi:hypothetical protein